MIHVVTSTGSIALIVIVAFGLTLLVTVMIANFMAARQEREKQKPSPSLPPHTLDTASFKRGA